MSKKGSSSDKQRTSEHVKKTLAALKGGKGSRYLGTNNDDFLASMEFRNQLPSVPCGPFLKKVSYHKAEAFGAYTPSSLENNHIWQRHCPTDMNIIVQLEDQESVLGALGDGEKKRTEHYFLKETLDKSKREQKHEHAAAHWWLRETKYGENQLFKDSNKKTIEVSSEEINHSYYDTDVIEGSFAQISDQDSNDEVEWSVPIIPENNFGESFSFTRFDEDPEEVQTWEKADQEIAAAKHTVGAKRMADSVITNIRDTKKKGKGYAVSMVVPQLVDSDDKNRFTWAYDYAMSLNTAMARSHYMLTVDEKTASYHSINAFIDLRRLEMDEVKPHDVEVHHVEQENT